MVDAAFKEGIHDEVQQFLMKNKINLSKLQNLGSQEQEEKNEKLLKLN